MNQAKRTELKRQRPVLVNDCPSDFRAGRISRSAVIGTVVVALLVLGLLVASLVGALRGVPHHA